MLKISFFSFCILFLFFTGSNTSAQEKTDPWLQQLIQTNASPTWFDHPTVVGLSANADGNYAFPVTAIKLVIGSGSGTVALTLVQAGD